MMMNPNADTETLKLTIALSLEAHTQARQIAMKQLNAPQAKQSYLDTLARYAVNFYLQCLGIETQWEGSEDVLMMSMMPVTDLSLPNVGKLECRVVLPRETSVMIPEEVWSDRIGYMAVQVDESLTEAEILGFVETVNVETFPLQQLQPVEFFLTRLHQLEMAKSANSEARQIQLHQWLSDLFEEGWETFESLFRSTQVAWRSLPDRNGALPETQNQLKPGVQRGKKFDFAGGEKVALMMEITPQESEPMDIWVRLLSLDRNLDLPDDLQFNILDEKGEAIVQLKARETPDIKVQFSAGLGDIFSIQLILDDESLTESFVV